MNHLLPRPVTGFPHYDFRMGWVPLVTRKGGRTTLWNHNGLVGKACRHEIGFFTTPPLILIFFLTPIFIIPLHMCPNRYILLLIVYIIFSALKACLNTYKNSILNEANLGHKNKNKYKIWMYQFLTAYWSLKYLYLFKIAFCLEGVVPKPLILLSVRLSDDPFSKRWANLLLSHQFFFPFLILQRRSLKKVCSCLDPFLFDL